MLEKLFQIYRKCWYDDCILQTSKIIRIEKYGEKLKRFRIAKNYLIDVCAASYENIFDKIIANHTQQQYP